MRVRLPPPLPPTSQSVIITSFHLTDSRERPAIRRCGSMVEQRFCNPLVAGSIPVICSIFAMCEHDTVHRLIESNDPYKEQSIAKNQTFKELWFPARSTTARKVRQPSRIFGTLAQLVRAPGS